VKMLRGCFCEKDIDYFTEFLAKLSIVTMPRQLGGVGRGL